MSENPAIGIPYMIKETNRTKRSAQNHAELRDEEPRKKGTYICMVRTPSVSSSSPIRQAVQTPPPSAGTHKPRPAQHQRFSPLHKHTNNVTRPTRPLFSEMLDLRARLCSSQFATQDNNNHICDEGKKNKRFTIQSQNKPKPQQKNDQKYFDHGYGIVRMYLYDMICHGNMKCI